MIPISPGQSGAFVFIGVHVIFSLMSPNICNMDGLLTRYLL